MADLQVAVNWMLIFLVIWVSWIVCDKDEKED